jgi:hypothetical protein
MKDSVTAVFKERKNMAHSLKVSGRLRAAEQHTAVQAGRQAGRQAGSSTLADSSGDAASCNSNGMLTQRMHALLMFA